MYKFIEVLEGIGKGIFIVLVISTILFGLWIFFAIGYHLAGVDMSPLVNSANLTIG